MADFDEILKMITENPDVMSKISEISKGADSESLSDKLNDVVNIISPLINEKKDDSKNTIISEKTNTPPSKINENAPSINSTPFDLGTRIGEKINKNSKLLLALKPYLSKERGDALDSIIKMAQVADLMKLMR